MAITLNCVFCGKKLQAPPEAIGKRVRCLSCNRGFVLVAAQPEQPASSIDKLPIPSQALTRAKLGSLQSIVAGSLSRLMPRQIAVAIGSFVILAGALGLLLATAANSRTRSERIDISQKSADAVPNKPAAGVERPAEESRVEEEPNRNVDAAGSAEAATGNEGVVEAALAAVVEIRGDKGLGSGFLLESSQIIVTNYHVVAGQEYLHVHFPDDKYAEADGFLVASPEYDLVILHIPEPAPEGKFLRAAPSRLKAGEEVFALGSPKGLSGSVTKGVVSAYRKEKDLRESLARTTDRSESRHGADATWLQTSAPISKGNSGGPLLSAAGDVVGINTWQLPAEIGQNLNFALAIEHVTKLSASMPSMRIRAFAELPDTLRRSEDRAITPQDRNMIAWGWQAEVLGRWYATSSYLTLPLAVPAPDKETTPAERRQAELVNQLRACAKRTFEDAEEIQRIPKEQLVPDLTEYIEDVIKSLAGISQSYLKAANGFYPMLRSDNEDAITKWNEEMLAAQRELNDLITTSGAAVKKRLESTLDRLLWAPIVMTPQGCLSLCSLEEQVNPEVFTAVFTGTPRVYLFPTYYRHEKTEEAAWILQFIIKDYREDSEPHKLAVKLLGERAQQKDNDNQLSPQGR